jgi:hypothetical protein
MDSRDLSALALALALAAPALLAQGTGTTAPRLIGFTSSSSSLAPLIQRQDLCRPSQRVCPTGMAPAAAAWAGGAAYDARHRSVWHTQGTRIAEIDIDNCRLLCSNAAVLALGAGSLASDLALSEARLEFYELETIPGVAALNIRHLRSCPLNLLSTCRIPLPTNRHLAGAMAVDEELGLIYYASSIFGPVTTVGPQNAILVARLGNPCNIVCRFTVDVCGTTRLGPITAMAYDPCADQLYVSDGAQTVTLQRDPTTVCSFRPVACCAPSPSAQTWHGFDIESDHPGQVGQSCFGPGCAGCNSMTLSGIGDPAIGNGAFALSIDNGEANAIAILGLGIGACVRPGVGIGCGFWHVPGAILFPAQILGGLGCNGSAYYPLPIPALYQLCGVQVCTQAFVICPGGGFGLTNAVQLTLSS